MDPEIQRHIRQQAKLSQVVGPNDLADLRASEGYVKGISLIKDPSLAPNPSYESLKVYLDVYQKDPIVAGAIDTVAEEAMKNGGYFIGEPREINRARILFEKLDFESIAKVHVKTRHIFGDSFVESVFDEKGSLSEVHNLETTEMFIAYNEHGEIERYEQRPFRGNGGVSISSSNPQNDLGVKKWSLEEVYFSKIKPLGSKVHSYAPMDPAVAALTARTFANNYIQGVFQNFKPQVIYSIENNVSPEQVRSLVDAIRAADKDPGKKILSVGDLKVQTSGMYEFKSDMVDILNYLRQEVLAFTRVPGIYVGITDGSNRGVSEMEATNFQTHLLSEQRDVEKLARWILEKARINAVYKCKPPSVKSQSDIIDQAKKLRDMGYGDEVITPFLFQNGIDIPQDAEFEMENTVSMDDMPSRQSGDKGVTEGKYKLDENGRSEKGKAKSAQMDKMMRSAESDSNLTPLQQNLIYLKNRLGVQ